MSERVGFVVNPIAGLGGRVGLKGTDDVVDLALARGAVPRAGERAIETLEALRQELRGGSPAPSFDWVTCSGSMGADVLRAAGFDVVEHVDRFEIAADLPGFRPEDVEVEYADRTLRVSGQRAAEELSVGSRVHLRERRPLRFLQIPLAFDGEFSESYFFLI